MKVDDRLGTLDEVMTGVDPAVRGIIMGLRDLIIDVDPDTVEQPRPGDKALSYGVGPRKMLDGYAYLAPQKTYANLGFYKGAILPDPDGLLEGTGKLLRHVKVYTLEQVEQPGIQRLIEAAVAERKAAPA